MADATPRVALTIPRLALTIAEAAEALAVSDKHIERLVDEADANRRSRWRWGRELTNLTLLGSKKRTVRVNIAAVVPGVEAMNNHGTSIELQYQDIAMILDHLHQSSRDGWYYGNRTHFCNRRDKLIAALEAKLPRELQT
jgi:hypothetical protein